MPRNERLLKPRFLNSPKQQGTVSEALRQALTDLRMKEQRSEVARQSGGRFELCPIWFHEGQKVAWETESQTVLLLCGKQSGKTSFGIYWLLREIQRKGPGDYAIVGPTLPILRKKALNESTRVLCREQKLAKYVGSNKLFEFTPEGIMSMFGTTDRVELYERYSRETNGVKEPFDLFEAEVRIHVIGAMDPNNLESGTYKGIWGDELGHPRVPVTSFENMQSRTAVNMGRIALTTTPYKLNWLKTRIYDTILDAVRKPKTSEYVVGETPEVCVVRFESWMNPHFGRKLFEKFRKGGMPSWRFDLFYRGIFTRPAGQIFDNFDTTRHTIRGVPISNEDTKLIGTDFGPVNFAAVRVNVSPKHKKAFIKFTYCPQVKRDTSEHVSKILTSDIDYVPLARGGAASEDNWRDEFGMNGLPITRPLISDREAAIQLLYSLFSKDLIVIDSICKNLIKEIEDYSRVVDDDGHVTTEIENRSEFHRLDALLYIVKDVENALRDMGAIAA